MPFIDRDRWQRLEPLLDRALELTDEERRAWLEQLRTASPDVAEELIALFSGEVVADRDGFLVAPFELLSGLADAFRSV